MSEKYELKRGQIIDAAEELFAYYGYYKTTLDDIAKKTGIKKNSIYYYFESKEKLLNKIISEIYDSKVKSFEEKSVHAKNTLEKLKIFLSVLISQPYKKTKKHSITPAAFVEISHVIEESFNEFFAEAENMLQKILNEGIKKGELRKCDAPAVSKTILEFTRSLEFLEYTRSNTEFISHEMRRNLEQRLMHFIELIYYGIKK